MFVAYLLVVCDRDLDKQEAEIKEKLKQEKKREERKNREAFSELLREDMDEGFIKPKMRWKVLTKPAHCCQLFQGLAYVHEAGLLHPEGLGILPCIHILDNIFCMYLCVELLLDIVRCCTFDCMLPADIHSSTFCAA